MYGVIVGIGFIYDINKFCKGENYCIKTLYLFNHLLFNNCNLQLLNEI